MLCQLLRRGWIAALAPKGVPNADIIVTDIEGNRQCAIQVKTRTKGADKGWPMRKKHEEIKSITLFYCFVDWEKEESELPITYIIPSTIVAPILQESHQLWLDTPGKNNAVHNDHDMRRLLPDYARSRKVEPDVGRRLGSGWMEQYREKWDILRCQPSIA